MDDTNMYLMNSWTSPSARNAKACRTAWLTERAAGNIRVCVTNEKHARQLRGALPMQKKNV